MPDHRHRYIHRRRDADSAQRVFQVMGAGNEHFLRCADLFLTAVQAQHDLSVPYKCAFLHFLLPAEEKHMAFYLLVQSFQPGIVRVEHRVVSGGLVPEHPHLQGRIDFHCTVAVQMVLGDICQQGHMRMERVRCFHLE